MKSVEIIGAGAYLPDRIVSNEELIAAMQLPGQKARWVEESVGIRERRFFYPVDGETGKAIVERDAPSAELAMAEAAARRALQAAEITPQDLDGVYHVTCTEAFPHFSHPAISLHATLGMKREAFAEHLPSGCGGFMIALQAAKERILSGYRRTVLVTASNTPSAFVDREAFMQSDAERHPIPSWLSLLLFGDGAGAVVLCGTENENRGILVSFTGVISGLSGTENPEAILVSHPGGGAHRPAFRSEPWEHTYFVHGPLVVRSYPPFMREAFSALRGMRHFTTSDVWRWYLHPANKVLVERVIGSESLPADRVPIHVETYGNLSAAATPVMLAEDLGAARAVLGSGQLVIFAAIGAGVHYGAHLVRL